MQNPIQNFMQSSIVSDKPGILSEKLKTLTSCNYHRVEYFLLKFCTCFILTNIYKQKGVRECLDLELFAKNNNKKNNWFLHTHKNQAFCSFINSTYKRN